MTELHRGLEGIVVAETRTSRVDGAGGALWLAGVPVEVAAAEGLEATTLRLWRAAGRQDIPADLAGALGRARQAVWARLPEAALGLHDGMAALRAGVDLVEPSGPVEIMAAVAVCAAAWIRARSGQDPLPPDPTRGHAADLLAMALGPLPRAELRAEMLSCYLACVSDHGLNASTFTARAVASTAASEQAAVVAALASLSGPLHGGAPGPVLDMLDAVGTPDNAEAWISAELAAGRRIMGMGHRVYRVRDPRAAVLEAAVRALAEAGVGGERLALAAAVEATATRLLQARHPDRPLAANVEFATAVLLEAIGLPRGAFSLMFACGRVAGWLAHTAEERRDGRLMRPRARYIGD